MCINRWMLSVSEEITLIDAMHRLFFICSILAETESARESARGAEWRGGLVFVVLKICSSSQIIMVLARPSPASASHPRSGDRILIFKPEWLGLVLSGHKTLEVRAMAYKAGKYYFGTGGSTIENMSEHRLVLVGGGREA